MQMSEESQLIINTSVDKQKLVDVLDKVISFMKEKKYKQTDLQHRIMVNHMNEMINRSVRQEQIPEVDASLFAEMSRESIELAKEIVNQIGGLGSDETYILAIHFETVKNN